MEFVEDKSCRWTRPRRNRQPGVTDGARAKRGGGRDANAAMGTFRRPGSRCQNLFNIWNSWDVKGTAGETALSIWSQSELSWLAYGNKTPRERRREAEADEQGHQRKSQTAADKVTFPVFASFYLFFSFVHMGLRHPVPLSWPVPQQDTDDHSSLIGILLGRVWLMYREQTNTRAEMDPRN